MADLMLGLGASQEVEQAVGVELKLPALRLSQADFKKWPAGLAARKCYRDVCRGLSGVLLKTMHRGPRHVGKAPGSAAPDARKC